MATTRDDIEEAKEACLNAFDDRLVEARKVLNSSPAADRPMLEAKIQDMRRQRTAMLMQDYIEQLNSAAMDAALQALKDATADMKSVAANMTSATNFINSLASFFTAAGKVVPALKGLG